MSLLKRIALIIAKVLAGILLLLAVLVGVLVWQSRTAEIDYEQFAVLESGDGRYILTIAVGNPVLAYGPHPVIISVNNAGDSVEIMAKKARISNDGMGIGPENIRARWLDADTAQVCMRGDEQQDATIRIDVPDRTVTEREGPC